MAVAKTNYQLVVGLLLFSVLALAETTSPVDKLSVGQIEEQLQVRKKDAIFSCLGVVGIWD